MNRFYTLLVLLLLVITLVKGQETYTDSEVNERLSYIQNVLEKDSHEGKIWWNGWLAGYSAATLVQLGVGLSADELTVRQDMYLGAVTTGLGAGFLLLTPMNKIGDKLFIETDSLTLEEKIEMLREAEMELEESANYERAIRSWKNHALTWVVDIGSGLITWLAFDRTIEDGLVNFAINILITEAQIWTISLHAKKNWEAYQLKYESGLSGIQKKTKMKFSLMAGPGCFTARLYF